MGIKLPMKKQTPKDQEDEANVSTVKKTTKEKAEDITEDTGKNEPELAEPEEKKTASKEAGKAVATVTTKMNSNGPETTEVLETPFAYDVDPKVHAVVGFEIATTINQGNYNSLRIGLSLKLPVPPEKVEEAFELMQTWADDKMNDMIPE